MGKRTAVAALLALAGCLKASSPTLTQLTITPEAARVPVGLTLQFEAAGLMSDGSASSLTNAVAWTVDDGFVASVDEQGRVTGKHQGTTQLRARKGGVEAARVLTVTDAVVRTLELGPSGATVPVGVQLQLVATALLSDGTTSDVTESAAWALDGANATATMSEARGVVVGTMPGPATAIATFGGVSARLELTVSAAQLAELTVTPFNPVLPKGTSVPLRANGRFSDGTSLDVTQQATWTSDDAAIAFVSTLAGERGLVSGRAAGSTHVTASLGGKRLRTPVQVTEATLQRLEVAPTSLQLPLGVPADVTLLGHYSDATRVDVGNSAQWTTSNAQVATVVRDASGVHVRGVAVGQATVRASVQGQSVELPVTIRAAELRSVELSFTSTSLPVGASATIVATGTFSDGTHQAVDELGTWASSAPTVLSVSNAAGQRGLVVALALGSATVSLTVGQIAGTVTIQVSAAELRRLVLDPAAPTLPAGTTQQLRVQAQYSDGSLRDVTDAATWSSAAPSIASVGDTGLSKGLVTAFAPGTAGVTAHHAGGSASTTVTVSPAALRQLSVTPATASLARGTQRQLSVTGTFSDGSTRDLTAQATWSSSAESVATVSNASGTEGTVTAVQEGVASLTASFGGQQSTASVTVTAASLSSVELSPASPSVPVGGTTPLSATGVYSDSSRQPLTASCGWSSDEPQVATVSNAPGAQGQLRGVAEGTTIVRADCGGVASQVTVRVSAAALSTISLSPAGLRLAQHTAGRLTASGTWTDGAVRDVTTQVTWRSTAATQVGVSPAGEVQAIAPGAVTVEASLDGVTGSTTVTVTDATLSQLEVTPAPLSVAAGLTRALTATGVFSDGSTQPLTEQVSWAVDDPQRARFSAQQPGLLEALTQGSTSARVTFLGQTTVVPVTVTSAVPQSLAVSPTSLRVPVGLSRSLVATARLSDGSQATVTAPVTWSTSAAGTATVVAGEVTGRALGQATVTASWGALSAPVPVTVTPATVSSLAITPASVSVPQGLEASLSVVALYSDGSTQDVTASAQWTSSAAAVQVVSAGRVRGAALGSADLQVSFDGQSASARVTVTAAVLRSLELGPAAAAVPVGLTQQLTATGIFSDGSSRAMTDVTTWSSSSPSSATVSNAQGEEGLVRALQAGPVTVTGSVGAVQGTLVVQIVPAALRQLALTPPNPSLAAGLSRQLTATGTYSDGSTRDVTADGFWSVVGPHASVGNGTSAGLVTGGSVGSAQVRMQLGGITGSTTVTVTPALVREIQVTPPTSRNPRGTSVQLTATAVFTDDSHQDVTSQAVWSSAAPSLVGVVATGSGAGEAQALNVGTATVTATFDGHSSTATVEVTAARLVSVAMTPALTTVPVASVRQLQLVGTFTDATTRTLTQDTLWQSSTPSVAVVSNADGTQGLLTALSLGTTTVTATYLTFTVSRTLTVNQSSLQSLLLTPSSGSTAVGFTRQFIAIGVYTDGSTQLVTDLVTWSTSDVTKAVISNASPVRGLLSTLAPGALTVTASLGAVSESTPHTVTPASLVALRISPATLTVQVGQSAPLVATGDFSDGTARALTSEVTWSSTTPLVAQVSNALGSEGTVTGLADGTTTVRATAPNGVTAQVTVTVTP